MKKIALAVALMVAAVAFVAEAQVRRDNRQQLGSPDTNVYLNGKLEVGASLYPVDTTLGVVVNGGFTVTGNAKVNGTLTQVTASVTTANVATENVALLDAGSGLVRQELQVVGTFTAAQLATAALIDAGTMLVRGDQQINGNLILNATTTKTTCTLNAASPSVCTATVRAGSTCACTPVGATAAIAAAGCAVGLSGTTLTATSLNGGTHVVNIHCF